MILSQLHFSLKMIFKLAVVWIVSILHLCNFANGLNQTNSLVPGIPIQSLSIGFVNNALMVAKDTCSPNQMFDCQNCTARLICDTKGAVLAVRSCTGLTPYCRGGICVEDLPAACPAPVSPLCPVPNKVFPSPLSCQRYVQCSANRTATEFLCPSNLVWDPVSTLCKKPLFSGDCPSINCTANRNNFIVYPLEKQFYFYCGGSGADPARLLQCANGMEFNVAELRCEPKCYNIGVMPAVSKKEYYLCVWNYSTGYDKYLLMCPDGTQFNANVKKCI